MVRHGEELQLGNEAVWPQPRNTDELTGLAPAWFSRFCPGLDQGSRRGPV